MPLSSHSNNLNCLHKEEIHTLINKSNKKMYMRDVIYHGAKNNMTGNGGRVVKWDDIHNYVKYFMGKHLT